MRADFGASVRLHSRDIWLTEFSERGRRHGIASGWLQSAAACGLLALEGFGRVFLAASKTIRLGILPVSPLLGTGGQGTLSLVEREDAFARAGERQDPVSPPVCSQLPSLLVSECYLGIFASWF